MFDIDSPDLLTSLALVPEQLCGYVRAVSGMRLRFCKGMAVYIYGDEAVLVGYPHAGALSAGVAEACGDVAALPESIHFDAEQLDSAVREVSAWDGLRKLTVLAPFRPAAAPAHAVSGPLHSFDHDGGNDGPLGSFEHDGKDSQLDTGSQFSVNHKSRHDSQLSTSKIGDCYYSLDFPFFRADGQAPGQKLRNMLRRAGRELEIRQENPADGWKNGCGALVEETLRTRVLPPGTRHIYGQIKTYLDNVPGAVLFTAREKTGSAVGSYLGGANEAGVSGVVDNSIEAKAVDVANVANVADGAGGPEKVGGCEPAGACAGPAGNMGGWGASDSENTGKAAPGNEQPGRLHGFCVGDFSALDTAFYMFAFRAADAVPGTADLLLSALVEEAQKRGHCRVSLGLCINGGIAFFKRKWGARAFLPYVETTWELRPSGKGFFARLFGK